MTQKDYGLSERDNVLVISQAVREGHSSTRELDRAIGYHSRERYLRKEKIIRERGQGDNDYLRLIG